MKVFKFTTNCRYGGGCAVVAANSEYEAFGALCYLNDMYAQYTDVKHCKLVEHLSTDVTIPTVIIANFYVE